MIVMLKKLVIGLLKTMRFFTVKCWVHRSDVMIPAARRSATIAGLARLITDVTAASVDQRRARAEGDAGVMRFTFMISSGSERRAKILE